MIHSSTVLGLPSPIRDFGKGKRRFQFPTFTTSISRVSISSAQIVRGSFKNVYLEHHFIMKLARYQLPRFNALVISGDISWRSITLCVSAHPVLSVRLP